ncbi:hypothetical protein MIB92_05205 [Aestuariirhabdus sp. Z084]|uniref:spermidine synthase n=1 Tax=Aestuariirhabdus haliotis TaxID=2918751 RepID=UPI00201B41C9|nr:hypothetical protein [Aestuariirhabdus haliotis]MCL6415038.1 hypothetical protein [Aestuariirhabdus haliotis]MCL6418970.1 hypothetical protein [Aestuariirhabdus haliotis]
MSLTGREIYRCYDELGSIQVFEDHDRRFLTFDGDAEQSCVLLEQPWSPVYQYCQAMLMASAFFDQPPQRAMMAGLGGGSMIHSLLRIHPQLHLEVLELRAAVIETARQFFLLDRAPAHRIHNIDATHFKGHGEGYDLIISDLFLDNCMNPAQLAESYTGHCQRMLSKRGILVLNLWLEEKKSYPDAIASLSQQFAGQLLSAEVPEGNLVLYLFNDKAPPFSHRILQRNARALAKQLDAPMQRVAAAISRPAFN